MNDGIIELERRLRELDGEPFVGKAGDVLADIRHFIFVMERVTMSGTPLAVGDFLCQSAKKADEIREKSHLLARLKAVVPQLACGPLAPKAQYWIGTSNPKRALELSETKFTDMTIAGDRKPGSNSWWSGGLFTSTGFHASFGMWGMYLHWGGEGDSFPKPWHVWSVAPVENVRVYEITGAEDWVRLVESYPRFQHGVLHPDWPLIARDFDAVHLTLNAIFAIQGLHFSSQEHLIAPSYWDVECTYWLRWRFRAVTMVQRVKE